MARNPFQNYIVSFKPGERIFSEGDIGTTMFVVQTGRVKLFREIDGETQGLGEMEKGDFFGEMSVLEGVPRMLCAEAVDKVDLIEINSATFDRMLRGNIEIAVRMLRKLSIRLRGAEKTIETLHRRIASQPAEPASAGARTSAAPANGQQGRATPAPPVATATPARDPRRPSRPATESKAAVSAAAKPARAPASARPATRPAPAASARATAVAEPESANASRLQKRGPRLVDDTGQVVFPLGSAESLIGRYDPVTETQPEVDLTPLDIKRSVSRRHARVTSANGNFFVTQEIGALNGTVLNGEKLQAGRPVELKDGDRISLGSVLLTFRI